MWNYVVDGNADISRGPSEGDGSISDFGSGVGASTDVYFSETREKLFYKDPDGADRVHERNCPVQLHNIVLSHLIL